MGSPGTRVALSMLVYGLVAAVLGDCGSSPGKRLFAMLPADGEVEDWRRVGLPTLITTDTEMYNQIDGAAPKYIDRGWQESIYATHGQGTTTLQVAVHDMGSAENAESMFNVDLPVSRIAVQGLPDTAIDVSLPTYRALAFVDRYYVEVNLDDGSDAALVSIQAFMAAILRR